MKKFIQITAVIACLMISVYIANPMSVFALEWSKKSSGSNTLHVSGTCTSDIVTVYLYGDGKGKAIYEAGADCKNGKFDFTDDLTEWNIPEGSYTVAVGEGQHSRDYSHSDKLNINKVKTTNVSGISSPNDAFGIAQQTFSYHLQGLVDSLSAMKISLDATNYSVTTKAALSEALNLLEAGVTGVQKGFARLEDAFAAPSPLPTAFVSNSDTESTPSATIVENTASPSASITPTPEASSSAEATSSAELH